MLFFFKRWSWTDTILLRIWCIFGTLTRFTGTLPNNSPLPAVAQLHFQQVKIKRCVQYRRNGNARMEESHLWSLHPSRSLSFHWTVPLVILIRAFILHPQKKNTQKDKKKNQDCGQNHQGRSKLADALNSCCCYETHTSDLILTPPSNDMYYLHTYIWKSTTCAFSVKWQKLLFRT